MLSVRVWDLPTRVFHWLLAASVVALVISAKLGGDWMVWHLRLGYLVLTLLLFRLLWGFVGGHWSRFARFVHGPGAVIDYLRGRAPLSHRVGHTPLGGLSVFALLAVLALQVGTGLVSDDEIAFTGPLIRFVSPAWSAAATGYHKDIGQFLVLGLVLLHLLAIAFYSWVRRETLVGPMWHGDKAVPEAVPGSVDSASRRLLAAVLAALCAAAVWALVTLGSASP